MLLWSYLVQACEPRRWHPWIYVIQVLPLTLVGDWVEKDTRISMEFLFWFFSTLANAFSLLAVIFFSFFYIFLCHFGVIVLLWQRKVTDLKRTQGSISIDFFSWFFYLQNLQLSRTLSSWQVFVQFCTKKPWKWSFTQLNQSDNYWNIGFPRILGLE